MKIIVTGGAGYIGSELVRALLLHGHLVLVLDKCYFGLEGLNGIHDAYALTQEDITRLSGPNSFLKLFEGVGAVYHLAGISNDPSAFLAPEATMKINVEGTYQVAELAKRAGVKTFVFASSTATYGCNPNEVDEDSPFNPQTVYAESKIEAEEVLNYMANENFRPTIFRQGTVCGPSMRMRYDLLVNCMVKSAILDKYIKVYGPGTTYRPVLALEDLVGAYTAVLEGKIPPGTYNIRGVNLTVKKTAELVAKVMDVPIEHTNDPSDPRNYRVKIDKLLSVWPHKFKGITEIAHDVAWFSKQHSKKLHNMCANPGTWFEQLLYMKEHFLEWRQIP